MIKVRNLKKRYGAIVAVNSISFHVEEGTIVGFLGPNGAGKTTTLRMIMDIIRPDRGEIELLGCRSIQHARPLIGYMPEERGLYRRMTLTKVLSYFGAIKGLPHHGLRERVRGWLERVNLAEHADKKVEELSRGMHQKLQFAVTAINDPELLILDEPFAGLDPINTDLIKSMILEMREQGKTVILSTHVMHEAEKLCDYILLINKGQAILNDRLAHIKQEHKSGAVCLEAEGDTDFIAHLPMVTAVESQDNYLEITLVDEEHAHELLKAVVDRVAVQRFEVKVPSLHEIFVNLVGTSNEQDS